MPASKLSNNTKPPLLRLIIASLIGVSIGYFLFTEMDTKQTGQDSTVKGTICLVIDDFGFALNSDVKKFLLLNKNMTAAIIPGTLYAESIGKYADSIGPSS